MKNKIALLLVLIAVIFLIFWYMGNYYRNALSKDLFILLSGAGIVIALYLLNRITIFNKKCLLALRHILDNNFKTGISMTGNDELTRLADRLNLVIDRINEYDLLRENKIVVFNRLLDILNRNIQAGAMTLDLEAGRIKINRSAQELFGINQDELTIDSVIKLESNSAFNKLYQDIVQGRANTIASNLELFLPILRAKASVNLKMFAIKDKDEKLNAILCLFINV